MEKEKNRVLTYDEAAALPVGSSVYGEFCPNDAAICHNGIRVSKPYDEVAGTIKLCGDVGYWSLDDDLYYSERFRVWSLPQPPTPEELAANPWPTEKEEA